MDDESDTTGGPTPHAVALTRTWLNIGGLVWLGFAAAMFAMRTEGETWPMLAVAAIGLLHFAIARFGSRRIAVFFAIFGP